MQAECKSNSIAFFNRLKNVKNVEKCEKSGKNDKNSNETFLESKNCKKIIGTSVFLLARTVKEILNNFWKVNF